ncbi:HepT-like ribonuclease domain-containing protein [Candidatus Palauibacter sp.]|uniref:HepT-like ribonuclease domain-containing protein n=1 Tax=Candidatus Palauibacter sp. TaxID=3101350 RepID=UPI003D112F58
MPRDDSAYLLDMLLAARDALSFTEGTSYHDFVQDRRTQLSVLKAVEIVGEAAAHVSEDTRQAHPDIPWREIVGMRNRLVHVYFDIDLSLVWATVRDDLPALITLLKPLVPPETE